MKCNETFEGKTTNQENNNGTLNFFCLAKELGKVTGSLVVPRLALHGLSRNWIREDFY